MTWKILKSDHDYYSAMERLDKIFHPRNKAEQDEFDLLILLITKYEEENFGIEESDPIQVIKMKMKYMGLRQKDLIDCFGSKATTSKILSYKSPLTLKHVWLLSERLELPIELLAKPYNVDEWSFMKKFKKAKRKKMASA
jgi:HTH-type transcriptional regulator/antitoxin HigA